MGNTEGIMTTLCDDRYFTQIDLAKGYWQIPVKEESKPMDVIFNHQQQIIPVPDDAVWSHQLGGNLQQDDEKAPQMLRQTFITT